MIIPSKVHIQNQYSQCPGKDQLGKCDFGI